LWAILNVCCATSACLGSPRNGRIKGRGYWLAGLDETAEKSYTDIDYTTPTGIVMGGEGNGLHELTRKRCDFLVSLPTTGPVKSLNVSVATGVVLFEALRQRHSKRSQ
jgi:23S rRNA (guanosine2251-2'-O)-methyltransferase